MTILQLEQNKARFEWAASKVYKSFQVKDFSRAVRWSYIAGYCASNSHAGFYVHTGIEAILNRIGREIVSSKLTNEFELPTIKKSGRNWLHVLTTATTVGGHTRFAERWIRNQTEVKADRHFVVAIDQGGFEFPKWLRDAAELSGGSCFMLPGNMGLIDRALALRKIAYNLADTVVLYIHPHDPVASVAFAPSGGPPVVLLNQADHLFWIGAGIADHVADIRMEGQRLSLSRRKIRHSELLPIPLLPNKKVHTTAEYKRRLDIGEDTTVLLSIGSSYKFRPYGSLNFPKIMTDVMRRHDNVILIVIGPSPLEKDWKVATSETNGKIKTLGVVKNLEDYYGAADIYIESFPVGSLTATLDAVLFGKPVIRSPKPLLPILCIDRYEGMDENAPDIETYNELLSKYITDIKHRQIAGGTQKKAVMDMHTGSGWNAYMDMLIANIPMQHDFAFREEGEADYQESDAIWADLQERQNQGFKLGLRLSYFHNRYLSKKDIVLCLQRSVKEAFQTFLFR